MLWFSLMTECALCLLLGAMVLRPYTIRQIVNPLLGGLAIFGITMFISTFQGVDPIRSLWGSFSRFQGVLFWWHGIVWTCIVVYLFRTYPARVKTFLQLSIWIAGICALYGVFEFIFGSLLFPDLSLPRASSFFGNPIYFANYLTIPFFLAAYAQTRISFSSKRVRYGIPLLLLLGIGVSVTRGALVGLGCGLVIAGLVYWFTERPRLRLGVLARMFLVVMGICFGISIVLFQNPVVGRLVHFEDQNVHSRMLLWGMAWHGVFDRPWFGVGPENYEFSANKYFNAELYAYNTIWNDKPHNGILEVAVTMGAVGVVSYCGLLLVSAWIVRRGYKSRALSGGQAGLLVGGMAAYCIQNLFSFDTPTALVMFFLLCAVIVEACTAEYVSAPHTSAHSQKATVVAFSLLVMAAAGVLYGCATIYGPTVRTLKVLGRGDMIQPILTNNMERDARALLSQSFVLDRGFVALLYADAVLMKATADTQENRQMVQAAVESLQKIVVKQPNTIQYWLTLNDLFIRQALLSGSIPVPAAEDAVSRAITLAPNRAEVWFARANLYLYQGKLRESQAAVQQSLRIYPTYVSAIWLQIKLLSGLGEHAQARTLAETAIENNQWPNRVGELQWLFDAYEKEHDLPKVIVLLDKSTAQYKQNFEFLFNAAQVYARMGEISKARDILYALQGQAGTVTTERIDQVLKTLPK